MSLAGCFAYSVAGGVPDDSDIKKNFPIIQKFIVAFLAPVAMHFIVVFGGEFYSGNTMYMTVGLLKKRVTVLMLLYNWASCFFWNAVGCILGVWLFGYATEIFAGEPHLTYITELAELKANMDPLIVFLRAIPGNFLICLAIQMGISVCTWPRAQSLISSSTICVSPNSTSSYAAGTRHVWQGSRTTHASHRLHHGRLRTRYRKPGCACSATPCHACEFMCAIRPTIDMNGLCYAVIVPLGCMYGANVNIGSFIINNLLPAAVGNAIGKDSVRPSPMPHSCADTPQCSSIMHQTKPPCGLLSTNDLVFRQFFHICADNGYIYIYNYNNNKIIITSRSWSRRSADWMDRNFAVQLGPGCRQHQPAA
jgi:formate/nitrite transporter FocA (FNT family)